MLLAVLALVACGGDPQAGSGSAVTAPSGVASSGSALAPAVATTKLRTVAVSSLPPEGVTTLELIRSGGPFPYSRDGITFQNREGLLPARPEGFYREYTVPTPGSVDRGARRIVAGSDGARFYSDDHYNSFREIVAG